MIKTIAITPTAMLNLVCGKPLTVVTSDRFKGARIKRAGYNEKAGEFFVQVESEAFEGEHFGERTPQEIRIEA